MNQEKELIRHISDNDPRTDFLYVEKYCRGLGYDVGCGSNRFAPTVLTTDWYPHDDTDLVWNCVHEGGRHPYPFRDERFDFVFSSHVIEDFKPDEIQWVFDEFFRLVKKGGYLVLLVPDMGNKRYPDWDEVFTEEDEEVKSGKRRAGELRGNPSHCLTMSYELLESLTHKHSNIKIVQADTIPHTSMSLDFVVQKLG